MDCPACPQSCLLCTGFCRGWGPGIPPCKRPKENQRTLFSEAQTILVVAAGLQVGLVLMTCSRSAQSLPFFHLGISRRVTAQTVALEVMHQQPTTQTPWLMAACASPLLPLGWSAGLCTGRLARGLGFGYSRLGLSGRLMALPVPSSSRRIWGILVVMAEARESKGQPGACARGWPLCHSNAQGQPRSQRRDRAHSGPGESH